MPSVLYSIFSSTGRAFYPEPTKPVLQATDSVVVEIRAASLNPVDYKLPKWFLHGRGVGLDFAGVVTQVSPDVKDFTVGDRVVGNTTGALADHTVVKPNLIAKLPDELTFQEGAALPIAYLTGYQGLVRHGFEAGAKILVIGASGGCGTAAIQLAKALGASEIVGVCSKKNEDFVKSVGANRIIDYNTQTIEDGHAGHFDFVYDAATGSGAGEDYLDKAKAVLKDPSKHHVTLNGPPTLWIRRFSGFPRKDVSLILTEQNGADLAKVVSLLVKTNQRPIIDSVFPFTAQGIVDAFEKLQSRRAKGKIVIDITNTTTDGAEQ
ncbi:hypothetical protein DYB32_010338 [Aphanomyces invadans]|uniref:Enoyl reductase (ER) domain-containing protein n=1 Tax=Aphanomyces invadans TaxID=157072 RepID=A0A3R7A1N9_9STRA|nr:hypothetical protein DYB32_010338 [Aphanomyces invadans]